MTVGMTSVFVPQDLAYMGLRPADLAAINPRLIPLIAHDRAGFGGGLCSVGIAVALCAWCGRVERAWWQAVTAAGVMGFGTAIGVHPLIGYTDAAHVGPAVVAGGIFLVGVVAMYLGMRSGGRVGEVAMGVGAR
jgi:hypothetical protein